MIRPATLADIPRIVELGELMHAEAVQREIPMNRERVAESVGNLINGAGVVFLAEKGGEVVGGIAGGVAQEWFSDRLVGYEHAIFIHPDHRHGLAALKLLAAMKAWCKTMGADVLDLGVTTGVNVESTRRLYEAIGAEEIGPLFRVRL